MESLFFPPCSHILSKAIERDDLCVCFFRSKLNWVVVQVGLVLPIFLLDRAVIGSLQIKAALEAWNVL